MQNEQDGLKGRAAETINSTPISPGKVFLKFSISFLDLFYFICTSVMSTCVSIHGAWFPCRPEVVAGSPGTRVTEVSC